MSYDKEFHEWARLHPADVSAVGINALLDEIDRLQSENNNLKLASDKLYYLMIDNPKSKKLADAVLDSIYGKDWRSLPQPPEEQE
ncbi:MAG: hypothetical protein GYA45_11745 [Pelolinea sp.]|nr:hypothetical protein [Pelolinea sp.]